MGRVVANQEFHLRNSTLRISRINGRIPPVSPVGAFEAYYDQDEAALLASVNGGPYTRFEPGASGVSVSRFGATGDGTTDDTDAIQEALDSGAGEVYVLRGSYAVTQILVPSNVRLRGESGAELVSLNSTGIPLVKLAGSVTATFAALTGNASAGSATVSVASSASFTIDDYVVVRDDTYFNSVDTAARNQEILRVKSKTGTVLTFTTPLIGSYTTAQSAQVALLDPVVGARVEGLAFRIPEGMKGGGITAEFAVRSVFIDVHVQGNFGWPALRLNTCYDCHFTRWSARDTPDLTLGDGTPYGLLFDEGTAYSSASFGYSENIREDIFTNYTHHCRYIGNTNRGNGWGFNCHGAHCTNIVIANNSVEDTTLGSGIHTGFPTCKTRDSNITIVGNTLSRLKGNGIMASRSGAGTEAARGMVIADNIIIDPGFGNNQAVGISLYGLEEFAVHDNVIRAAGGLSPYGILVDLCSGGSVHDNAVSGIVNGYGVGVRDCTRVMVDQNRMTAVSSYNLRDLAGNTGCAARLNLSDDTTVSLTGVGLASSLNTWD